MRVSLEEKIDKIMDDRNYEITNKLNDVLNNVKGFDVAMSNPRQGKMLVRYNGISFYITILELSMVMLTLAVQLLAEM